MRREMPGLGTDPASVRQRIEAMEKVLERMFVIPGINKPVGLDVILDIVPGIGTISAAALGSYIAWEARNLGMSKWQVARMAGNIGFDMLLGADPLDRRDPRPLLPVQHTQFDGSSSGTWTSTTRNKDDRHPAGLDSQHRRRLPRDHALFVGLERPTSEAGSRRC